MMRFAAVNFVMLDRHCMMTPIVMSKTSFRLRFLGSEPEDLYKINDFFSTLKSSRF